MEEFTQILVERLKKMGMEANVICAFIRDLEKVLSTGPRSDLSQVNQRLHLLGWDDLELDYRTLELATACFEFERLNDLENDQRSIM